MSAPTVNDAMARAVGDIIQKARELDQLKADLRALVEKLKEDGRPGDPTSLLTNVIADRIEFLISEKS